MIRGSYRRCSVNQVFWEISQNSQKNSCARVSFLVRLQARGFSLTIPRFPCKSRNRLNTSLIVTLFCLIYPRINKDFFSIRVFFHRHWRFTGQQGKEGYFFYSTLPPPPTYEHWDIYLQLCMWDDYYVFLITTLVFTRLLLNEIYHLIELPFDWLIDDAMFVCLLDELILGFCYSDLTWETGGFEFTSTITLVLQTNRLTKRVKI